MAPALPPADHSIAYHETTPAERALDLASALHLTAQDFAELAMLCADQAGMSVRSQARLMTVLEDECDVRPGTYTKGAL